ncbi:MAG: lipopolysaccharide heptosyltransferase II [Planctomycetales bacterium]|nr:lipopolysaccharide heptosyltransferase II [Planctomycetales bacterium]
MKIVLFLPNWIGDAVMATPAVRAVRHHFAGAKLIGVMRPRVAETLAGLPWLDESVHFHPRAGDPQLGTWQLVRRLRRQKPDIALLLPNSLRTGMMGWLSGAARRVGYAQYGRGPLLTDKLKFRKAKGRILPTPAMDAYLQLAYLLGCPPERAQTELRTRPADEAAADRAWQQLDLPPGHEVIVLNTGAAYGKAKNWPTAHFAKLATQIANRQQRTVLVICGPQEHATAAEIVARADHPRVKSLAGQPLSVGLSKACVRRSRLVVSTDSGPRHFAAAFDVPVVTLYGPTHVAWGDTHYRHAVHLQHPVPCGPCMKRVCPLGHHLCMRELSVQQVYAAVEKLLVATERHIADPLLSVPA